MGAVSDVRTALGFLTRIPVGPIEGAYRGLGRAAAYFPLVGVVVAAAGLGAWWVGTSLLGPLAGAVLSVLAVVVITGALHEDGLADFADGLWGGATPADRLEIMRDSRIGTYGVVAVVGDLLLRIALLAQFGTTDWLDAAAVLLAGHVIGRAAPIALAATLPPARSDGLGVRLSTPTRGELAIALVTVVAVAVAAVGWWAPVPVLAAALTVAAVRRAARRRLGGVTGDVYGAAVALTNLAVAAVVVALVREGMGWDV
jgi:adenosylcobinamide-GDP ribazoletransferase